MDFLEKRKIKELALKKNLRLKLKQARYEFFKEIIKRGGIFENAGDEQERQLCEFRNSLYALSINTTLRNQIINEINSFIDFMQNYSGSNEDILKYAHKQIKLYEKEALKVA